VRENGEWNKIVIDIGGEGLWRGLGYRYALFIIYFCEMYEVSPSLSWVDPSLSVG